MLEYPEIVCIRNDMRNTLLGKCIAQVSVHDMKKYAGTIRQSLLNQPPDVFSRRLEGGVLVAVDNISQTLLLTFDTANTLSLGAIYGSIRFHPTSDTLPRKKPPCLQIIFADETFLSVTVNLFGEIRIFDAKEKAAYLARRESHLVTPDSDQFTLKDFQNALNKEKIAKVSVKKFLTSRMPVHFVDGLEGGYVQEILYRARLYPKRKIRSLSAHEQEAYYRSIKEVTAEAIQKHGRWNEKDLYGQPGKYTPHVCRDTLDKPCSECGSTIIKFQFEGGACYVCPGCQPIPNK